MRILGEDRRYTDYLANCVNYSIEKPSKLLQTFTLAGIALFEYYVIITSMTTKTQLLDCKENGVAKEQLMDIE